MGKIRYAAELGWRVGRHQGELGLGVDQRGGGRAEVAVALAGVGADCIEQCGLAMMREMGEFGPFGQPEVPTRQNLQVLEGDLQQVGSPGDPVRGLADAGAEFGRRPALFVHEGLIEPGLFQRRHVGALAALDDLLDANVPRVVCHDDRQRIASTQLTTSAP